MSRKEWMDDKRETGNDTIQYVNVYLCTITENYVKKLINLL